MSNLPPGVRVSDIPGAVPTETEAAAEAIFDAVASRRERRRLDEAAVNELCERLRRLQGAAYGLGYDHGMAVERELPLPRSVNPSTPRRALRREPRTEDELKLDRVVRFWITEAGKRAL
jgi:hypothetical protein